MVSLYFFYFIYKDKKNNFQMSHINKIKWALWRGVIVSKLVSLDQLRPNMYFHPHWMPHTFGLVPHLSYAYKKISINEIEKKKKMILYFMFEIFVIFKFSYVTQIKMLVFDLIRRLQCQSLVMVILIEIMRDWNLQTTFSISTDIHSSVNALRQEQVTSKYPEIRISYLVN